VDGSIFGAGLTMKQREREIDMRRRNNLNVIEKAHLRTNQELYNENYDRIFGFKDNTLHAASPSEEEILRQREAQGVQVSESSEGSSEQME